MSLLGSLAKMAVAAGKMLSEADNKVEDYVRPEGTPTISQLKQQYEKDARSFDVKLKEVLAERSDIMIEEFVPVDEIELQAGKQIYKRGNCATPDAFTYKLSANGKSVYIRVWKKYLTYDHVANRQVKTYCDMNGIKVLDFFEYLPNGVNYMRERILEALN